MEESKSFKFTGTLVYIGEIEEIKSQKTGNVFIKRDIAVADDPNAQYPTIVVATLKAGKKRDNTTLVSDRDINRPCTLEFFPDGRFYIDRNWKKRVMAGNTAWRITFTGSDSSVPEPADPTEESISYEEVEDLPF